ncbi:glutamate--tRNA ligase [Ahrensia marina]|uniref:glutamate--tRNA ligase n=1 Tax=Ahrensia marina TaxID=1514904 RepID=UPI0035D1361D
MSQSGHTTTQAAVVTRFAPSPTGFLHIGGARTALFNWLYAKSVGGVMRLRIEDTDRSRSTTEAIAAILDSLSWLGLDHDGETVFQSQRADRHAEVAHQLLADGKAYKCYATPDELTQMREDARAAGKPPRYDGRWRDRPASDAPEGAPFAVRIKAPTDGLTVVHDQVQGEVKTPNKDLDDFIILRSDGTPTYMLAVVVDDHDMGVTHVIRGDDHLTNAARQSVIYDALGWDRPVFAHIPLIHGPDGAKLSKRHGAVGAEAYRADGFLPDTMRNYLARLGWAHGDDEIFSTEQAIEWFGFDGMGKSAARFDVKKLTALNAHYMRELSIDAFQSAFNASLPYLPNKDKLPNPFEGDAKARFETALPGLRERARTLVELIDSAAFLFAQRPLAMDEKAATLLTDEARGHLAALHGLYGALEAWTVEPLEAATKAYAEQAEIKLGAVAQPLRAALTGSKTSPGIYDVLIALGREESLARIGDQTQP